MRDVQAAQTKKKNLQHSVDECQSRRAEAEKLQTSAITDGLLKRRTAAAFLIIGIIIGLVLIFGTVLGGIACLAIGILIFVLVRKSASEEDHNVRLMQDRIDKIDEEMKQYEKEIVKLQAIIDHPFDDIDLLNMDMTPEDIALLEKEVKLLFRYKIDYPSFLIGKSCWLLKYAQLNFFDKNEEDEARHDACMNKLENSGSWILKIARLYCLAYLANFTMQVVNSALLRQNSGNEQAVSKESIDMAILLEKAEIRPAETPEEDEFIQLLMDALAVNDPNEIADVYVNSEGLDKLLMPNTPEMEKTIRQNVENYIASVFEQIQKSVSIFDLMDQRDQVLFQRVKDQCNVKQRRWLDARIHEVNTAEETHPNLYVRVYLCMYGLLASIEKSYIRVRPQIYDILDGIKNEHDASVENAVYRATGIMEQNGMSAEARKQFVNSARYISAVHSVGAPFRDLLREKGVSAWTDSDGYLMYSRDAAFQMFIHESGDDNTDDCMELSKVIPVWNFTHRDKEFLCTVTNILKELRIEDKTITGLVK